MIKRPICFGAVFLVIVILIADRFGVHSGAPPFLKFEGERIRILGRIAFREQSGKGTRLYLDHFSILSPSETMVKSPEEDPVSDNTFDINYSINHSIEHSSRDQILAFPGNFASGSASVGSWVVMTGKCTLPEKATNPGQFDSEQYYRTKRVVFFLRDARVVNRDSERGGLQTFLAVIRGRISESYERTMDKEEADLLSAITLGDRSELSPETRRLYQEGGIAHILAVSSLHITLLGRGFYRFLRKKRCSFLCSGLLSCLLLTGFCVMIGGSVSAVRASLMFALWAGSQVAGRTNDGYICAAVSAGLLLADQGEYLWDSSFLLSFACILSLICLQRIMEKLLPIPGRVGKALQASIAIQIGTLPIVMYFFYQVTPYAVMVNLAVLPCMSLLMAAGLMGGIAGLISIPAGTLACAPCHYLLHFFAWLCQWERKLPGAVLITGRPELWQITIYYSVLAGIWILFTVSDDRERSGQSGKRKKLKKYAGSRRQRKVKRVFRLSAVWIVLMTAVLILTVRPKPELRITFLDVGQGDGILIEAGEFACMIDGGSSSVDKVWEYRIEKALKYYGISRLSAIFLSHGDEDHISGTQQLMETYEKNILGENAGGITVERLILPDTGYADEKLELLRRMANEKGIETGYLGEGGMAVFGGTVFFCLHPDAEKASGEKNADSMVLLLEKDGFRALFTGDLEREGEQEFLNNFEERFGDGERIDVLKVGHHGSRFATSKEFLEVMQPSAAVISCGRDNLYGHPAQEVLDRLENSGIRIFRTDLSGAVTLSLCRNGDIAVKTEAALAEETDIR